MPIIELERRSGVTVRFNCDLTDADARRIVLQAHAAHQQVGDFAIKLATQRAGLSPAQSGWLKYLALEISGQLRTTTSGPWAWLLDRPFSNEQIRIQRPPIAERCDGTSTFLAGAVVELRRDTRFMPLNTAQHPWEFVGRINSQGGFELSASLMQRASGQGRGAMAMKFPKEEEALRDEARWLQSQAQLLMEALKR
jgi:hypothetical protein